MFQKAKLPNALASPTSTGRARAQPLTEAGLDPIATREGTQRLVGHTSNRLARSMGRDSAGGAKPTGWKVERRATMARDYGVHVSDGMPMERRIRFDRHHVQSA
jgi:hypothetical protein